MKTGFSANDEISSTERLLDVIRDEGVPYTGLREIPVVQRPSRARRIRRFLLSSLSLQKRINIAVDLGHSSLTLVKIAQLSDCRHKVLDYRTIPFTPNAHIGSPGFADFLGSAVMDFCGPLRKVNLWTTISTAKVDVRAIRIPRVAKKEVFNAIFWTAKREMNFDEKESLFDFEVQGDLIEDGIPKLRVMAYTAPRDAVKQVKELFSRTGLTLAGITDGAFAIQNLFRTDWVPTDDINTYANLYLSDAYSRIAIFFEGNLILTREIKTGVDSLIISLIESFHNAKEKPSLETVDGAEAPAPLDALEEKLDALDVDWERAKNLLFSQGDNDAPGIPHHGAAGEAEREDIVNLVRSSLERLIRQVERTFEYRSRLGVGEPVERIFISGAANIREPVIDHISQSLGIKTEIMDPLGPANVFSTSVPPPLSMAERMPYTATLGLALSDNSRTPNLLFTFKERQEQAAVTRMNRGIFSLFLSVVVFLGGFLIYQGYVSRQKHAEISTLQLELAQYSPAVDQNLVIQTAAKVKNQQHILKRKASEYLGIAVLSELSALTPANIRLLSITADLGGMSEAQPKETKSGQQSKVVSKSLVLDGIVRGESQNLESSLARFLLKLGSSPMFINPTIHSSSYETYQDIGEVLHFVLKIGLS
jgi:Tfp pilus assembly PilM family ATPase